MVDRDELCKRLGLGETKLEQFIEEGLPHEGIDPDDQEFDESEVATWLLVHGKAEINRDRVAVTLAEAARRLGVQRQTLRDWSKLEGFPGDQGYYPIDEIRDWNDERVKRLNQYVDTSTVEEKSARELSIKEQRDLLKLQQEQELLIEVEEVRRMLVRVSSYIVAELNLIPGRVESRLPAGFDIEATRIMRDVLKHTIDECCELVSEFDIWGQDDSVESEA